MVNTGEEVGRGEDYSNSFIGISINWEEEPMKNW